MELVGAAYYTPGSEVTSHYLVAMTVEEFLEMTGASVFIAGLVSYLATYGPALQVVPEPSGQAVPEPDAPPQTGVAPPRPAPPQETAAWV